MTSIFRFLNPPIVRTNLLGANENRLLDLTGRKSSRSALANDRVRTNTWRCAFSFIERNSNGRRIFYGIKRIEGREANYGGGECFRRFSTKTPNVERPVYNRCFDVISLG